MLGSSRQTVKFVLEFFLISWYVYPFNSLFPIQSINTIIGQAAFICETEGCDRRVVGDGSDFCPHCRPLFSWNRLKIHDLLSHIGAHLLYDSSLDPSLELCGLCFRPAPLCVFFLRRGKGVGSSQQIDLRTSRCPNLIPFSYLSAAKEATHSPCTNVPVICPLCPSTSSAVWKYNMKAHFEKSHTSAVYRTYSTDFPISESEREGLKKIWESRFKKRRQSKSSKPKTNLLPISEAHSSRRVFS